MKRLLTISALLFFTACAAATGSPTSSPSPTADASTTATATITPSPSATWTITPDASHTPYVTKTPPAPTPDFPFAQVRHSLVLSTGSSPTCELPCWHDLRVGESTEADVEQVFTELLDADEEFDFFFYPIYSPTNYEIEGVYAGGHNWTIEESEEIVRGTGYYYLHAFLDEETGLLLGITEIIKSYTAYKAPTLVEVIDRLGKPDWIYGGRAANGYIIYLVYEQGIMVSLDFPFKRLLDTSTALFCFNVDTIGETYRLVDPYDSLDQEDWSIMQSLISIPTDPAPFIDERLKMDSIEEFIEFVNSDFPCWETPRHDYEGE